MRKLLFAMLLMLLISAPAGATSIVDDENANDEIGTAGIQISRGGADPGVYVGSFSLTQNDADFVGLGPLVAGDVITAVTTPLEDGFFQVPDTILGVFNAAGVLLAFNDDAGSGFGSAIRFLVPSDGDYFLAVSGLGDNFFQGLHGEEGSYVFTVSLVPPTPTPTPTPTATPTPTPTPTAEPACTDLWESTKITTMGKGQSPINNPKVAMSISGFIVDPDSLGSTAHRIPVCSGTLVTIAVSDSTGTPTITAGGSLTCTGLICTVTPVVTEKFKVVSSDGKDTDRMTLLPK